MNDIDSVQARVRERCNAESMVQRLKRGLASIYGQQDIVIHGSVPGATRLVY
jgi:hypothetical protein